MAFPGKRRKARHSDPAPPSVGRATVRCAGEGGRILRASPAVAGSFVYNGAKSCTSCRRISGMIRRFTPLNRRSDARRFAAVSGQTWRISAIFAREPELDTTTSREKIFLLQTGLSIQANAGARSAPFFREIRGPALAMLRSRPARHTVRESWHVPSAWSVGKHGAEEKPNTMSAMTRLRNGAGRSVSGSPDRARRRKAGDRAVPDTVGITARRQ